MALKLPQELIDQAIDHLWNDVKTLSACALTCHAFLPSARTHIFRDQRIIGAKGCARFEAFLESCPGVMRYVRTLSIVEPASTAYPQDWVERIPALLLKLERLTTLELVGLHYVSFQRCTPEAISAFARLTNISAFDVYFNHFLDVHTLLAAACNVKSICFYRVGWANSTPPAYGHGPPDPMPLHLNRLIIDCWATTGLLRQWLLPSAELEDVHIRTLMIRWRERGNMDLLNSLFRVCGPVLQHLYVEIPTSIEGSQEALTLYHNTNLRFLEIDGLVLPGSVVWVSALLAQLRSTRLQKLSFSMLVLNSNALACFEWDQLEAFLSRPQFVDVAVTIHVNRALHPSNDPDTIHSAIVGYLPGVVQRSKLEIKCSFPLKSR